MKFEPFIQLNLQNNIEIGLIDDIDGLKVSDYEIQNENVKSKLIHLINHVKGDNLEISSRRQRLNSDEVTSQTDLERMALQPFGAGSFQEYSIHIVEEKF